MLIRAGAQGRRASTQRVAAVTTLYVIPTVVGIAHDAFTPFVINLEMVMARKMVGCLGAEPKGTAQLILGFHGVHWLHGLSPRGPLST